MINANELRIGNWLIWGSGDMQEFINVRQINDKGEIGFVPKMFKQYKYIRRVNSGFKPIRLTEEILLKCGFEFYDYEADEVDDITDEDDGIYLSFKFQPNGKRFYYFCTINPDKSVEFGIKTSWTEDMLLATPEYLHQLQNIYFALTNEELKIDLNNKQ